MSSGIDWNMRSFQQFDLRVTKFQRRFSPAAVKALSGVVGSAVLRDAVNIPPTVPKAPVPYGGTLRMSGMVRIESASASQATAEIGFDVPYAAPMHAGRWETGPLAGKVVRWWSEPGSGPGFLGSKLQRFRRKYVDLAIAEIRRLVGM